MHGRIFSYFLGVVYFFGTQAAAAINCPIDQNNRFDAIVKIVSEGGDCTGTIVRKCFVLTAAHCVFKQDKQEEPSSFTIKAGAHSDDSLGSVLSVHPHPNFKKFERYDIALLRLNKCAVKDAEIEFGPFTSNRELIVGGYGSTKLNSFLGQPDRHMGQNKIESFDEKKICLGTAKVAADGITVSGEYGCLPIGGDSGSPFLQQGKVRGVFTNSEQTWLSDGTTEVSRSCAINLHDPKVRSFLEEIFKKYSPPSPQYRQIEPDHITR